MPCVERVHLAPPLIMLYSRQSFLLLLPIPIQLTGLHHVLILLYHFRGAPVDGERSLRRRRRELPMASFAMLLAWMRSAS